MKDGFINVLKPPGMSSGAVVAMVRRVTGNKAGHAGTLDPEACGVLPVMVGRATRLFDLLVEKRKIYLAEIAFGTVTDTQDAQGKIVARGETTVSKKEIEEVLPQFTGDIFQTPPMYSALKIGGETLYKMARRGKQAEIPPRVVHVERIELIGMTPRSGALMRVVCGRGTYIRTLCQDIGAAVGCFAHMRFLERLQTGVFGLENAFTIEQIKADWEACMLPVDYPIGYLERFDIPGSLRKKCLNGVPLRPGEWPGGPQGTRMRIYSEGRFIGIYYAGSDGYLFPGTILGEL